MRFALAFCGAVSVAGAAACARVEVGEPAGGESLGHTSEAVEASTQVIPRKAGANYEIEVRGQQTLNRRGENSPTLRVGEATFVVYKNTPDTLKGAVYPVTAEQFAELPDGAEVRVVWNAGAPGLPYGHLNKASLEVAP